MSFPGSLILPPPGASEERPWFGLVTCVVRLCGLVQLHVGTSHIVKICSWRQKNNCTPHARQPRLCVWKIFESPLPRNESKPCLLWRSWEQWLNNLRIFRALITGSRSHFERRDTVKRFTDWNVNFAENEA